MYFSPNTLYGNLIQLAHHHFHTLSELHSWVFNSCSETRFLKLMNLKFWIYQTAAIILWSWIDVIQIWKRLSSVQRCCLYPHSSPSSRSKLVKNMANDGSGNRAHDKIIRYCPFSVSYHYGWIISYTNVKSQD